MGGWVGGWVGDGWALPLDAHLPELPACLARAQYWSLKLRSQPTMPAATLAWPPARLPAACRWSTTAPWAGPWWLASCWGTPR